MRLERIVEIARAPAGRLIASTIGLAAVVFVCRHVGLSRVRAALSVSGTFLPWIVLLEGGILACSVMALRRLYGEDRRRLPPEALVRAGLIGYAVMGLVPAGRTCAESTRAVLLARYSSGGRAAAAAARLQAISLLANAGISVPALIATYLVLGPSVPAGLIAANLLVTAMAGTSILLVSRRTRIGMLLGKKIPALESFGKEFDLHLSGRESAAFPAFCWEFAGRLLQVAQNGVLIAAVGGGIGLIPAFCSESLHLVGAAAGDLIPAQLGATEISYAAGARLLSLSAAGALSIPLLAHLAQLIWVAVGSLVPVLGSVTRFNHPDSQGENA